MALFNESVFWRLSLPTRNVLHEFAFSPRFLPVVKAPRAMPLNAVLFSTLSTVRANGSAKSAAWNEAVVLFHKLALHCAKSSRKPARVLAAEVSLRPGVLRKVQLRSLAWPSALRVFPGECDAFLRGQIRPLAWKQIFPGLYPFALSQLFSFLAYESFLEQNRRTGSRSRNLKPPPSQNLTRAHELNNKSRDRSSENQPRGIQSESKQQNTAEQRQRHRWNI
jgi:hypothetical protein